MRYRERIRSTFTGSAPKTENYNLQPRGRRMVEGEVGNTTHGDRDTFLELRDYLRGTAGDAAHVSCFGPSYARGCACDRSFGDGKSALAVASIDTFTSLHLPTLGTRPIVWRCCSWNAPRTPVVFANFDSGRCDHAGPGPRRMEMAACSVRCVLTCLPIIRVGYTDGHPAAVRTEGQGLHQLRTGHADARRPRLSRSCQSAGRSVCQHAFIYGHKRGHTRNCRDICMGSIPR